MYLIINGYEFGQWLRILLWIGMPLSVFFMLLTTWLNYRRGHSFGGQLMLSVEGMEKGETFSAPPKEPVGDGRVDTERSVNDGEGDYKDNVYKGILWMKEKYEQYRDLADQRYDRLKEQLTRMEKKYEDLLESVRHTGAVGVGHVGVGPCRDSPVDQGPGLSAGAPGATAMQAAVPMDAIRIQELETQVEEKQRKIVDLEVRLTTDGLKIEELVKKLRNNSQLLTNIYQEVDKSLHFNETPPQG
jgi:hypothetical protein